MMCWLDFPSIIAIYPGLVDTHLGVPSLITSSYPVDVASLFEQVV